MQQSKLNFYFIFFYLFFIILFINNRKIYKYWGILLEYKFLLKSHFIPEIMEIKKYL